MKKARIMDDKLRDRLKLLGLKIAYYRKRRGLTQEQLAERVDCSHSYLARIEASSGETPLVPPIDFYYRIADELGIPLTKLVDEEDR